MIAENTRPMAVLSEEDRERLWQAFFAGFMSSGEGWNGEWPFERRGTEENISAVKETFEKWLSNPASVPGPNWGNK